MKSTRDKSAQQLAKPLVTWCRANFRDLHATMLHLLGIEHAKLNVKFQGLDARLTNVSGPVVHDII